VLYVDDAVAAYRAVLAGIDRLSGRAFNLGGGPANAVSLRTMLAAIEEVTGRRVARSLEPARIGDQPWFVADTRRLSAATGWRAETGWQRGLPALHAWLMRERFAAPPAARFLKGAAHARRAGQPALGF
jgi:CDP-paratose 2-epimerase